MNGQFFPGSNEALNNQANQRLLHEANKAQKLRKAFGGGSKPSPVKYSPRSPQPRIAAPVFSAVLTALLAIQAAFLASF